MKLLSILALTVCLVFTAFAQVPQPKTENLQVVAESQEGLVFFVNSDDVEITKEGTVFYAAIAKDENNWVIFKIRAGCFEKEVTILEIWMNENGKKMYHKFKNPEKEKAKEPFNLGLKLVCGEES
jgi:predicted Zn-dependent protease